MVQATESTVINVPPDEAGKEIKPVPYPRGAESQFEELMASITEAATEQFFNQTVKELNKSTVEKFADAQTGNYAKAFLRLANAAKRKLRKRFNKKRIRKEVTRILESVTKNSQKQFYAELEDKIGVSANAMIKREGLTPQYNALLEETIAWTEKNFDDTLQYMTNNTLRLMAEGSTIEEIEKGYKLEKSKRVNDAKFIARNQLSTYNGMQNKVRYQKLGIQKARWQTAEDEKVRPCHAARNDKVYDIDKGLYSSCDGKTLHAGQDYNCFPGWSKLDGTPSCEKFFRHWYTGKLSILTMDNGSRLASTPNHPILTTEGFKAAQFINAGDNIITASNKASNVVELYGESAIPEFEQIFSSLVLHGATVSVSASKGRDFHGDMTNGEVDVVELDSLLRDEVYPALFEKLAELRFTDADKKIVLKFLSGFGEPSFGDIGLGLSSDSIMSRLNLIIPLLCSHLTPLELFGLASCPSYNSVFGDNPSDNVSADSERFRDCVFAFSVLVSGADIILHKLDLFRSGILGKVDSTFFDVSVEGGLSNPCDQTSLFDGSTGHYEVQRVVDNVVSDFSGHVYNLQNVLAHYITDNVVVSNCRCVAIPILPGEEDESE